MFVNTDKVVLEFVAAPDLGVGVLKYLRDDDNDGLLVEAIVLEAAAIFLPFPFLLLLVLVSSLDDSTIDCDWIDNNGASFFFLFFEVSSVKSLSFSFGTAGKGSNDDDDNLVFLLSSC